MSIFMQRTFLKESFERHLLINELLQFCVIKPSQSSQFLTTVLQTIWDIRGCQP